MKKEVPTTLMEANMVTQKDALLVVKVGDIIVLKEGTRFYKPGEQYLVIQINPSWRYKRGTHTGQTETINKYFLLGNGNEYKVDIDEIAYVDRNLDKKRKI